MEELVDGQGRYRSPPRRVSAFARAFPGARFYSRVVSIVVRASRCAQRGAYDTAAWVASSREILRALEEVGVRVEVDGAAGFRALDTPCVFVGNHMSTLETFVLPGIVASSRETTFVVKESLVDYPVFKHVMRARNPVTVGRDNPREDLKAVLEGGEARLRAGTSMIVFPQTTRGLVFDPAAFNTIGVKLARRAGVPVVPVALKTDAWGNGKRLKDFGRIDPAKTVHFAFGDPIPVVGRGAVEHQAVVDFVAAHLRRWGGQVAGR